MAGRIGGPPESFSLSPLLALLPEGGKLTRLEALVSSLFARHEKVEALKSEAIDKDNQRRYSLEAAMLRQILEWLAEKPEGDE